MSLDDIAERLASHPKLIHALFVGLVLLTQVGVVAADNGMTGTGGP
jgi:hypothetical protein